MSDKNSKNQNTPTKSDDDIEVVEDDYSQDDVDLDEAGSYDDDQSSGQLIFYTILVLFFIVASLLAGFIVFLK